MQQSAFWNQRHETMARDDLEKLQLRRLTNLLKWSYEKVGLYRRKLDEAGVHPKDMHELSDLRRVPLLTREEWMTSLEQHPPLGELLAIDRSAGMRFHMTSGSSGRTRLPVLDTPSDWEWITEMWCYGAWGAGIRPTDRVFFAFGYGSFIGFWGGHYACEKIGAEVLPGGAMTTEGRLNLIAEIEPTVVCATPTYALRMAQLAQEMGIDLPSSSVRTLIVSGEPGGSIPATRGLIGEQWGAEVIDVSGLTEVGTLMTFECTHHPGGMHIIEDHLIEEVVDGQTGNPVPYGEIGERVVTSFGRGSMPIIRYQTRDLVVKVPASTCGCGRTYDIYEGGIRGRADDMKLIRGTNVYPSSIEAIVRDYREVHEFQIRLFTEGAIRDEIEVLVETADAADNDDLVQRLSHDLGAAHGGLRFSARVVPAETLPRFELKANRLVDERQVTGATDRKEA